MNIPAYAINHRAVIYCVTAILVGWGAFVYQTAPRKEDPSFVVRDAGLITVWPGATAEQMEQLVTDPLEKAIEGVSAIRRVQSSSYPNLSVIQITLKDEVVDAKIWWDKVRDEVDLAKPLLPVGSLPSLLNDQMTQATVMNLSIYQDPKSAGRRYTPRELEDFSKQLRDNIMDLRNLLPSERGRPAKPNPMAPAFVERAELYGLQNEAIYVETEMGKWGQLALTPEQLGSLLVQRNIVTPAGTIDSDLNKYYLHLSGQLSAVEEIENVIVGRVSASSGGSKQPESLLALARLAREGDKSSRDTLGPVPLSISQAAPVALKDLDVTVTRGYQNPPKSLTRFTDKQSSAPSVILSFTMKPGVNIGALDRGVADAIDKARSTYLPPDIEVIRTSDQPAAVEAKVQEVSSNVVSSVAVVIVVLIFMAGLRMSLIAGMAVPMIMLITIGIMRYWNVELEQVSLSALIIALGMLVDSTIQVCDNTQTHLNRGESGVQAAIKGTQEIAAPILIAAGTVIASFLPMVFIIPGAANEALVSLPIVVCLAMAIGWVFAVTMTAIMAANFMRPSSGTNWAADLVAKLRKNKPSGDPAPSDRPGLYKRLALLAIKMRWPLIGVCYAALLASPLIAPPMDFFPKAVRNQFVVELYLPAGTPIAKTDEVAKQVEKAIQRLDQKTYRDGSWEALEGGRLTNISSFVGSGGPFNFLGLYPKVGGSNFAVLWVNTVAPEDVPQFVADLRMATALGMGTPGDEDHLPPVTGARVVPQRLVTGEPIMSPIDIRVLGPRLADKKLLRTYADKVKRVLHDSGMAWNIHDSWGEQVLQLDVDIDQEKANLAGVTNATVALSMNAFYSGYPLTTYREEDRQIPVLLRLPSAQRGSIDDLQNAYVQGFVGKLPLTSIAEIKQSWQPSCIERYKRERNMAVRCRPEGQLIYSQVLEVVADQLDAIEDEMPPGYRLEVGGTKELADKGNSVMGLVLAVAVASIFLLLVIQFNSIPKTMIILLTLPLAVPGGLFGLQLMGLTLGFTCLLGFVALAGIVLSAAILLMDFSARLVGDRVAAGEGLPDPGQKSCSGLSQEAFRNAIADAGQLRFMPIMMTTLTTIGGLLSLMFAGGPLFEGLATVIVVGLILGTALSLFVLPALMAVFVEDFGLKLAPVPDSADLPETSGLPESSE